MAVLAKVLDTYKDRVDVVFWDDMSRSGNINEQIIREILNSRYGVCYFSEKVVGAAAVPYCDNPNVIFEAGMFHVLSHTNLGSAEGCRRAVA